MTLPRQTHFGWHPHNGHVPPAYDGVRDERRGFRQVDAGWYTHSVRVRRRGARAAWNLNPLDTVLDDLQAWVHRLLRHLPRRTDVQAYFDVLGRDEHGTSSSWRAVGYTLLTQHQIRDLVQQLIEDALQDPSNVMVVVESIRMFVVIVPRADEVVLVDGGGGGAAAAAAAAAARRRRW